MNFRKFNFLFIGLALSALVCILPGCDVIEEPYNKTSKPIIVDSTKPKILLEDFTATQCINCPKGADVYHALQEQYSNKIIVVSIHGGSLAVPNAEYPADFTTDEGKQLIFDYGAEVAGMPCALVNRREHASKMTLDRSQWAGAITEYWENFATTPLRIKLNATIDASGKVSADVNLDYLTPSTTQHLISVWLLEDGIVAPQKSIDPPHHIADYVHNNVLRYSFNGAYGENVGSATSIAVGFQWNKNYTYNVTDDWNKDNLRIVAFVYDKSTGIVLQVEETDIIAK